MGGFKCADENEVCNCIGMVEYGIYDWNDKVYANSTMKKVTGSIKCIIDNFENFPSLPPRLKRTCKCFPTSNRLFNKNLQLYILFF